MIEWIYPVGKPLVIECPRLLGGRGGRSLLFLNLSFDLLDAEPDNVTSRFIQLFAAKIEVFHRLLVCPDFQLDILRILCFRSACTRRHAITSLSVYTFIILWCTQKVKRFLKIFLFAGGEQSLQCGLRRSQDFILDGFCDSSAHNAVRVCLMAENARFSPEKITGSFRRTMYCPPLSPK